MFYQFDPNGTVEKITDTEAHVRMKAISEQWEDETHKLGKIWLGVYDWAYTDDSVHIPFLRTGGSIPANPVANSVLGGAPIFGDCFLKVKDEQIISIDTLLIGKNILFQDKTTINLITDEKSKMTYQERFELLRKELVEKGETYIKIHDKITQIDGFGDVGEMNDYMKARREWQEASNNYWGFIVFIKKENKTNTDDTILS